MKFFSGYDFTIVISSLLLLATSLIILSSLDGGLFQNQLVFVLLGIFVFIIFSLLNVGALQNVSWPFYIGALLLFILTFVIGSEIRGAKRWIELGGVTIQTSELVKPFLILAFASLLCRWREKITFGRFILWILFFLPIVFLLARQPDLGSVLVYSITFIFMLMAGGISIWYFLSGGFFFLISAPFVWKLLADYQKNRIVTFLNPKHDPLGIGYNAIQSTIAVGSGLLFGRGLGRGVQSQLSFLPERHTDFIFATFSEQFGFVGALIVLSLYFFLLLRILYIAKNTKSLFESYIALGVFALILTQAFINIGMNIGIVPITGVTLPLLSYGGSSIISTLIALGLVNAIARPMRQKQNTLEIR
ncbi:rod shape-determining protein RodA [Candidatus Microgenomates bacterium]|nr:rod shape-determining protein RodA [Candidatus Microgenomates bacterium]